MQKKNYLSFLLRLFCLQKRPMIHCWAYAFEHNHFLMNPERGLLIDWRYSWISWYPFRGNPQEIWNPYLQQTLKHIPSRFWKLIPCRARTSLPRFIQSYSSQGLITGLSSANCHGRSHSPKFFLPPAEFIRVPQHSLSIQSPRGAYLCYPQPENPPELNTPQSLSFSIPSQVKTSNCQSPAEPD